MAHSKRPSQKSLRFAAGLRDTYRGKRRRLIAFLIVAVVVWAAYTAVSGMFTSEAASLAVFVAFAAIAAILGILGYDMQKSKSAYDRALRERGLTDGDVVQFTREGK